MNTKENTYLENFLKFTAIIPIVGILLYSLGWNYWDKYFEEFGIAETLISLSIEKIIITTWPFLIGAILLANFPIIHILENKTEDKFEILTAVFVIFIAILLGVESELTNTGFLVTFLVAVFVFIILKILDRKRKITLAKMSRINYIILICVSTYAFGIYFYRSVGSRDAIAFKKDFKQNVQLTLNDKTEILGSLITNMDNKYFLLVTDKNQVKRVIILNDSNVSKLEILTTKSANSGHKKLPNL